MKKQVVYNSTNICGLLGIAFVVLKLVGVINWSWVWVTAPFWIPVIFLLLFSIFAVFTVVLVLLKNTK